MPIKHILLAILVAAVWGCNFVFVKLGVHEIPPLFLCTLRFFLASMPAIFFVQRPAGSFKLVAMYGLIMFALQFAFIFTGIAAGMPAGMASLLTQTAVFFSIFFAAIFIGEMPTIWQMIGALISFSGIGIAAIHLDSHMTLTGFLLVIAGAAVFGIGTLINRKLGKTSVSSLITWASLIAFPPLMIFSLLTEGSEQIYNAVHHLSWLAVISLFYIAYVSTWVGYGIWGYLLTRYPVSDVVPFSLLVPVFAMLGSALFLGEQFEPWKIVVAALVIGGLGINLLVPRLLARKRA